MIFSTNNMCYYKDAFGFCGLNLLSIGRTRIVCCAKQINSISSLQMVISVSILPSFNSFVAVLVNIHSIPFSGSHLLYSTSKVAVMLKNGARVACAVVFGMIATCPAFFSPHCLLRSPFRLASNNAPVRSIVSDTKGIMSGSISSSQSKAHLSENAPAINLAPPRQTAAGKAFEAQVGGYLVEAGRNTCITELNPM